MNKFIFDVDGTLTPSRQNMDAEFQRWFLEFCHGNHVYLVTGSDHAKTIEQVGNDIFENAKRVYNCNGNDVWEGGVNIRTNDWVLPEDAHEWLSARLIDSDFPIRTGLHFEHRPGMVNFSVVGRNATREQRAHYVKWDKDTSERENISSLFNSLFTDLESTVGGETGIDIAPKGANKSQIKRDFWGDEKLYFFGDAMHPGGNDYPLAQVVDVSRQVTGWQQTWEYLQIFQEQGIAN